MLSEPSKRGWTVRQLPNTDGSSMRGRAAGWLESNTPNDAGPGERSRCRPKADRIDPGRHIHCVAHIVNRGGGAIPERHDQRPLCPPHYFGTTDGKQRLRIELAALAF
jgi:hypothetical protein